MFIIYNIYHLIILVEKIIGKFINLNNKLKSVVKINSHTGQEFILIRVYFFAESPI